MKMNKKGFTLIELLAVIVVLAIIALIATPIVMNVITKAQEGANKRSVEGYMKAYEAAYYENWLAAGEAPAASAVTGVEYNGDTVTCTGIDLVNDKFTATCTVNGVSYTYANGEATK